MRRRNTLAAGMTAAFLATLPAQRCVADIPAPLLACTAETDDTQRLACFDRAVAQMGKSAEAATAARAATPIGQPASGGPPPARVAAAPPATAPAATPGAARATAPAVAPAAAPAAAAVAPAQPSSPPPQSPEEDFGLRTKRDRPSQQLTELTATAATISTKPHGELVVTLDNDQVWAEIAPGKIKLKPGDPVRIEAGTLGSFILIAPNGRSSKVKRVR